MQTSWLYVVVGAALVQFLWEAALVGLMVVAAQPLLREARASVRYLVNCLALFALPVLFVATLAVIAASGGDAANAGWLSVSDPWRLGLAPYLVAAWAAGMVLLGGYTLAGWAWAQRIRHGVSAAVPEAWRVELERLRVRMRVPARVRLGLSARVGGACAVGWLRPIVLLPLSAVTALGPEQLQALLAHELAHIRRHDYVVNLAQRVVEVLFFFHPAVWWLSRQVANERELCCDDLAVAACGDRAGYARALVDLAAWQSAAPAAVVAFTGGVLGERVGRLLGHQAARRGGWARAAMALLLVAACGGWLMGAQAVPPSPLPPVPAAPTVPAEPSLPALPSVSPVPQSAPRPEPAPRPRVPVPPEPVPNPAVGKPAVVALTVAMVQVCVPQPAWVPEILPSGLEVLQLQVVTQCVPVVRPEVLVLSSL